MPKASEHNFISPKWVSRNTSKFTIEERSLVKTLVATLSIKRVPGTEIVEEIERQANNTITRSGPSISIISLIRNILLNID